MHQSKIDTFLITSHFLFTFQLVCFALVAFAYGDDEAVEAPKAILPALAYGLPYAYQYAAAPLAYTIVS